MVPWNILGMGLANKRRHYSVTTSLIGWAYTQNEPGKINFPPGDQSVSLCMTLPPDFTSSLPQAMLTWHLALVGCKGHLKSFFDLSFTEELVDIIYNDLGLSVQEEYCCYEGKMLYCDVSSVLTHWGRETYICVGNLIIIGSNNGLSPGRRQAIIWTNAGRVLIGPLGTNFSEILIGIQTFSFKKLHLKTSSAKWRLFCLGLNELIQ